MPVRILFTKDLNEPEIRAKLGADFEPSFISVIQTVPLDFDSNLGTFTDFIFTSKNGVKFTLAKNLNFPKTARFYTVGEKAAQALRAQGFEVKFTAKNAEDLAEFLIHQEKQNTQFLHFCSRIALDTLEKKLTQNGISYTQRVVYDTLPTEPVCTENYDTLVFFSPSGVRSYLKNNTLKKEKLFTIGKTTQNTLRDFTDAEVFRSEEETLAGLLKTIKTVYHVEK